MLSKLVLGLILDSLEMVTHHVMSPAYN